MGVDPADAPPRQSASFDHDKHLFVREPMRRWQSREQLLLAAGHTAQYQLAQNEGMDEDQTVLLQQALQPSERGRPREKTPPDRGVDEHGLHPRRRLTSSTPKPEPYSIFSRF